MTASTAAPTLELRGAASRRRGHAVEVFEPATGGVPEYVASLVEGLRGRGWRVSVLAPEGAAVLGRLADVGAEVATFSFRHRPAPSDGAAILRLARICRQDADVVHGHSTKASLVAAGASRLSGVPSVYTPHAWAFVGAASPRVASAYAAFERAMGRVHRAIVAVAEEEGRLAADHGIAAWNAIHVVHTGVRPARRVVSRAAARARLSLADDAFVACWIGRHAPQKRPQDLVCLAQLLAGSGVELAALGFGLDRSVEGTAMLAAGGRLVGPATDPADLLAAADVFVQTSAWEGFSIAVLQAMQAGLPVVAYGAGGVGEQVEHGRTGYVVPVGAVHELAGRLVELAGSRPDARRMGEASRRRAARRFSYDRMLDGIEAVYDAVGERNRVGSQIRERSTGSQIRERSTGSQIRERSTGSQTRETSTGSQTHEREVPR